MRTATGIALGVAAFGSLLALGAATSWFGLVTQRPMAKYAEETRRQVYDESRSYQQGMAIDLADLCRQWRGATDPDLKNGLADTIRLRSDRFTGELPPFVSRCVEQVQ